MAARVIDLARNPIRGRLDRGLADAWPDVSRSRLQALIRDGRVSVDGAVLRDPSGRIPAGTSLLLDEPAPVPAVPQPEAIPLAIVFEDDEVVVLDKPAGLVVHPGAGHEHGTLVNALLAHCGPSLSGIGGVLRPGIVHRIDKNTSGLLMVAKTQRAHASLSAQLADHGRTGVLERAYLAFAWGVPEPRRGRLEAAIERSSAHREKMAVVAAGRGRYAATCYAVEQVFEDSDGEPVASLVRCELETGRTHQIRVHLAHLHHPLVGDDVYGAGFRTKVGRLSPAARDAVTALGGRQALHASLLQFAHPADGRTMRFESALPPDLAVLHRTLAARATSSLRPS